MDTPQAFVWGPNGQQLSPEQRAQLSVIQKGPDFSPVGSWTEGMARVADAMAGAYNAQGQSFPTAPGGATPGFGTQLSNLFTLRNNGGLY
jgi:hypothetical protein